MWEDIHVGFEDETVNFGPREEVWTGPQVFEIHTWITVSTLNKEKTSPNIFCATSPQYIGLAVDTQLSLFVQESHELLITFDFDSPVDTLAFSEDSKLLLVGETVGTLHIFDVAQQRRLLAVPLVLCKDERREKSFLSINITPADSEGCITIMVLTKLQLIMFYNINFAQLEEAIKSQDQTLMQKAQAAFQKELYTFPEHFTPSDCCSVVSCNKVTDAVGVGCGQFGMWLNKCLNVKPEVFLSSSCFQGQGGKKVQASADGRYLIVLDNEKKINILCSVTLLLIDSLEEFIVEDFELVETSNSESGEILESRIALLTRHENGAARTLQLLSFPFFELQYSVSLSEYSILAHGFQNQEYIFVVEGVNSSEDSGDGISSLRVRAVCEASPETRLTKLINKQKFEEALDFARKWDLDLQMVYQTQVTFLLDRLSPWVPARFKRQDAEDILIEVTELLSKCTDDHFVAECCLQAAPSSYLGVYSLLNFAQKRLEDCKKCEDHCVLISLVNNRLHRLVTLLEIFEESEIDFGIKWWEFSKADLLDMFLNFLRKNSTTRAFLLWNQHQGELAVRLTEDVIKDILHLMPDSLCTKELVMWLEKNFIPLILRQIPSAVDIVASWLTQTALNMEVLKKESWPDSAIELLEVLPNVCDHVGHQSVMGTTTVSVEISLHLWQRIAATNSSSLATLLELLSNLKELKNLKKNYGCHLSLSDFCQEDKVAVVFLILDWVRDINMMERLLQLFLCNYMKKNELDEGNTLLSYIQEVLDTSPHTWWYWEEAPWEEKVLAVINCMQQYSDQRMTAIVATISQAPLPWNLALQTLVDQELSTDHPRKYELETQVRSIGLKLILKKYEQRNFNINNTGAAEVLVQYILSQDRATALEDALEVVKAYDHISDIDCYLFYMRFMLQKERLDSFMDLISLLEPTKLEVCCERFISFVEMLLEEPDLWRDELNSRYLRVMTIGSVYILKKLLEHQVKWREKLQDFENCLHLQVEFGTVCSPYALLDKKWCWNFLVEKVESFLEGKPLMPIMQVVGEKKKQKVNTSYSHFYILGEILGFKRESVMGLFAQKMAKQGSFGIAITFCRELVAIYPSVTSAEILLSICEHFCQNLNDFDQTTEQSAYIFHSLHNLVMHTVTFCTPALLPRCIALSQWTSLLAGLADLATSNLMHSMNNTMRLDHYTIWRFSPLYRDQGLKIQMEYVVPGVTDYINICLNNQNSKLPEKNMCSWNRLVKYLREKGQEQGTLRFIVTACQNDLLVMNKADGDNKVYTSAIQQMKPIIRDIILSLISRICSQKRVDSFLSLGLISSLNKKEAIGVLKDLVRLCGTDFRRLSAVSLVGWEYSKLSSLPEAVLEFSNLNTRSTWGTRLAKLGISFKDAFSTSSQQECYRLLVDLVENHQVDITFIQEYCEAFHLEVDEALLTYLKSLLLGTEIQQWLYNPGWSLKELIKVNTTLSKAENVIAAINNPELLLDTLKTICEKVDPYCYEVLCFVHKYILHIETKVPSSCGNWTEKGLELLKFLEIYKRRSPPSEYEIDHWLSSHPEQDDLPEIAKYRLPFQPLFTGDTWKIIGAELSEKTVYIWLSVATLLNLSSDQLRVVAVQNVVIQLLSSTTRKYAFWHQEYSQNNLLVFLKKIFSEISNPEMATACGSWVVKRLPPGSTKVMAAQASVQLAQKWVLTSDNDHKAAEAFHKLKGLYRRLATEQVLHNFRLDKAETLSLTQQPSVLIVHLLSNFGSNRLLQTSSAVVHNAVQKIAIINECNVEEVYTTLMDQWLPPVVDSKHSGDETITMHFQLDLNMLDSSTKTDHENLQRVIHLLHHNSIEDKALHLLNIALKDDPSIAMKYRARALRCLISLCDQTTIQRLSGQDVDSIIDLLECLMYSSQLETFGLPYTPTDFKLCAKNELLESLLTMQGHNPDVLKFVVCLCVDKKMWDPKIWTAILRNMRDLYMMENLFHLQNYLSAVPELWHLPIYVKVWEDLLNPSIRHQGQKENSVIENYAQLIRCPCLLKLDAHFLIEELKISKTPILGLVILFLTCSSNNLLQVFLESVNLERIEKDFEQLSTRGTTLVNWVKNWYEETKKHTN